MDKAYIEESYRIACLDFKLAHNEEEQWEARKAMAKLEELAAVEYGLAYADELHQKEWG